MNFIKEGIIRYDQSDFNSITSIPANEFRIIEKYRKKLNELNLIAAYDDGLGFGNISCRKDYQKLHKTDNPQFLITSSQTGHLKELTGTHYTRVLDFSIEAFSLKTQGALNASSEAVTHAAIYNLNPNIGAIIHFHNLNIWEKMIKAETPSTGKWVIYGTYEMAIAVKDCIGDKTQGIFVMKGHREGVIAYGPNLNTTLNIVKKIYS